MKIFKKGFNPLTVSVKISVTYFVLGCLWILLSDRLTSVLISDRGYLERISMIKGWIYVLLSASFIFLLIFYSLKQIKRTEKKLLESYDELSDTHSKLESAYNEITASGEVLQQQYNQLMENQQQLMESEIRYRLISEATNDAIWEERNGERFFSDRWFEIMGYTREELREIGDWKALMHPEDKEYVIKTMSEHKALKMPYYQCEYRLRKKDGEYIWIQTRGKALFDEMGEVIRMAGSHSDITDLKASKEQLHYLAYHDSLTGLPNKLSLIRDTEGPFGTKGSKAALMFIDMDNFKYINDTMGHSFGDQFIVKVSERLRALLKGHSLYRLGGDEFIIIIQNIREQRDTEIFAMQILSGFKDRFEIDGSILNTSVSIGIAIYPEHGDNLHDLLKCADIAMYKAKQQGRHRYVLYDSYMNKEFSVRMDIEKQMRLALTRDEFEIYYQPQLELGRNRITGLEALLRWKSPALGFVPPAEFIGIAEDTHLIIPLGAWVLRNTCAFLKKLHAMGYIDLIMSVNISIIQLLQSDFVDMINDTLELLKIEPKYLELEITESVLIESFEAIDAKLEKLRAIGVSIALDDFGKGYSSLSYLRQLPISALKIDKSFIDCIPGGDKNGVLTNHIILIGNSLGICVIAEGVETNEQLDYLIRHGCSRIQGYLFSKPVPEEEVVTLLEKNY